MSRYCANCGAKVLKGAKFCINCGHVLTSQQEVSLEPEPAGEGSQEQFFPGGWTAATILGVAVLIGISLFAWLLVGSGGEEREPSEGLIQEQVGTYKLQRKVAGSEPPAADGRPVEGYKLLYRSSNGSEILHFVWVFSYESEAVNVVEQEAYYYASFPIVTKVETIGRTRKEVFAESAASIQTESGNEVVVWSTGKIVGEAKGSAGDVREFFYNCKNY